MNDNKRKYTLDEITNKLKRWLDNDREITGLTIENNPEGDDYGPDTNFVITLTDTKTERRM
ncbi:hypothetical protein IEO_03066 [Bacillus wiedmannii]|uniref:hypothetical protein n=1 Tax=Bacillus wiedmannii TaxID=1890302 RepID=UPI00027C0162|nr:hypothetical protein [Bacillus wiedmannii]EJV61771.1 hypothetical protein IEO_03066 [Bacillus wiedmannii]